MNKLLAATVVVALASPPAAADDPIVVVGFGAIIGGCGEWVARSGELVDDFAYSNWVFGYLSAINAWVPWTSNVTRSMPNESILLWVKNYCRAHPLVQVSTAAHALIDELTGVPSADVSPPVAPRIIPPARPARRQAYPDQLLPPR